MEHNAKRFRPRANRYRFTINNPFVTEAKVVDINNLTAEQKELYEKNMNRNNYEHLKTPEYEKYFDFAVCEYEQREYGDVFSKVVSERIFFKNYDMACEYFKTIDFIDFVCFQYEQGALTGTKHLQGFMHFYKAMDFNLVRSIFPTIHLDKCTEVNSYYIDYCRKDETKIADYPSFSHGVIPADERTRTDTDAFRRDVLDLKITIKELFIRHPYLTMQGLPKIKQLRQEIIDEEYANKIRDVHVTYIYGKSRAGKTTYPRRVLGYSPIEVAKVGKYNTTGQFDDYKGQDVILFDEFKNQIPLTEMNDYIEGEPLHLSARQTNRVACYTKVFICSNYPLDEQYKKARQDGDEPSYLAFCERIHEIIYMPDRNVYIWQKGRPTDEVIEKLKEQGAKITLLPQKTEQTKIKGVE